MRRRVRLLPIVIVLACISIAFFWVSSTLDRRIDEAESLYQQAVTANSDLETDQNDLKETLANASSDAFIESQARTLYDYMKQDEIRIVITNPEALYGADGK